MQVSVLGCNRLLPARLPARVVCCSGLGHSVVSVMESKIRQKLAADKVVIKDAYGDGQYLSVSVVASVFEGKETTERRMMLYKAVWEEIKYEEHIIEQIRVLTPAEDDAGMLNTPVDPFAT